MPPIST